ncbi:MAG: beta-phosphoglucomutase [Bacilli bacterium]
MMIKGIIFDLDGVIVSTDEFHYLAWKKISDEEGIEFTRKINDRLRGVSRMDSLEIILEKSDRVYSQEEKEELATRKNNYYVDLIKELTPDNLLPDVYDTLLILKSEGYKLAIASSSKNAPRIVEYLEIADLFDVIVDGTMITKSKPDPEVFLLAKDKLGLKETEVLVVEDAVAGIDAANAAGIKSCGINGADKYSGCYYKLKSIKDLLTILGIGESL